MKLHAFAALLLAAAAPLFAQTPAPSKRTPPPGVAIPETDRKELTDGAAALARQIAELRVKPANAALLPDIEIFHKAVDWALRFDEFMDVKQVASAKRALAEGAARAAEMKGGRTPWANATGPVLRGYVSRIDGSVQPYAVVVPEDWKAESKSPRPLLVWLAGRNDKRTELAFLDERWKSKGEFTPPGAFVLHPYGRFCNATKFAGETDVFEALAVARERYSVDRARIAVGGFSMGGASAWHLAAHHAGLWTAATPGAGFAETAVYAKVFAPGKTPPPWWEQVLWREYDATAWAANLFNTPLLAYSGAEDPQKQSADIMEKAMAAEGLKLERLIGPKTGHKYETEAKKELERWLAELLAKGREPMPPRVRFTSYTLRYSKMEWLELDAMERHWERADIDAELVDEGTFRISTKNVAAFTIALPVATAPLDKTHRSRVVVDGQELVGPQVTDYWQALFRKTEGKWALVTNLPPAPQAVGNLPPNKPAAALDAQRRRAAATRSLAKRHGLTGPIDDAFRDSFIFVRPTGKPLNEKIGAWVKSELERATEQWRTVFRGEARVKDDNALTPDDIANSNLVLWGDPTSNSALTRILPTLPLTWTADRLTLGKLALDAAHHAPVLIFPNPMNPRRYVVLNSSFTFREGSAQTNSQQTPKLPDWALIDLRTPPNGKAPGTIVDAGFFDEKWALPR